MESTMKHALRRVLNNWIVQEVLPVRRWTYLKKVYHRIHSITIDHNARHLRVAYVTLGFQLWMALRHLAMVVLPLDPEHHYLLADFVYLFHMEHSKVSNLIGVLLYLVTGGTLYLMYFTSNPVVWNIQQVYFYNNPQCFMIPYQWSKKSGKRYDICTVLQKRVALVFYLLELAVVPLGFFAIYMHYFMFLDQGKTTYQDYLIQWMFLKLTIVEVNLFSFVLALYIMLHVFHIAIAFFTALTLVLWVQFAQIKSILSIRLKSLSSKLLERLLRHHTQNVVFVVQLNDHYSKMLVGFLLIALPLNINLVHSFTNWNTLRQSTVLVLFFVCIFVIQILGAFGIHLVCALYTQKIHGYGPKRLIHLDTRGILNSHRLQTRVALYVQHFHTTNPYGITYGPWFGLVNMAKFGEFILFYFKCLIMTYNLVWNNQL